MIRRNRGGASAGNELPKRRVRLPRRREVAVGVAIVLVGGGLQLVLGAPSAQAATYTTALGSWSGGLKCGAWASFPVPAGATNVSFRLTGGGGAAGDNNGGTGGLGGQGGVVSGSIDGAAGTTLWARIGCGGTDQGATTTAAGYIAGGYVNDTTGGGGGGASALCRGGSACTDGMIAIAGGGGGGGGAACNVFCANKYNGGTGGSGGATTPGSTRNGGTAVNGTSGGAGAGGNRPGAAGTGTVNAPGDTTTAPGAGPTYGVGGTGVPGDSAAGGGGGGGLLGGGGGGKGKYACCDYGGGGGGAGGTSWVTDASNITNEQFSTSGTTNQGACDASSRSTAVTGEYAGHGGTPGLPGCAGYITITYSLNSTGTAFTTPPSASTTAGSTFAIQPVVRASNSGSPTGGIQDETIRLTYSGTQANGTPVTNAVLSCATNPLVTDANGNASFSNCLIGTPGDYTITATNTTTPAAVAVAVTITATNGWSGFTPTLPVTCGTNQSYALPTNATSASLTAKGGGGGSGTRLGGTAGGAGADGHVASLPTFALPGAATNALTYPLLSYKVGCDGKGGAYAGNGTGAGGAGGNGWGNGGQGGSGTNTSNSWNGGGGGGGGGSIACLAGAATVCGGTSYEPLVVAAGGAGGGAGRSNGGGGNGGKDGGGDGAPPTPGTAPVGNQTWQHGGGWAGTGLGGNGGESGRNAGGGGGGGGTGGKGGNGQSSYTGGNGGANSAVGSPGLGRSSTTPATTPSPTGDGGGNGGAGGSTTESGNNSRDTTGGGGGGGGYTGGGGGGADYSAAAGGGGNGSSWGATAIAGIGVTPTFAQDGGGAGAAKNTGNNQVGGAAGTAGSISALLAGNGITLVNPGPKSNVVGTTVDNLQIGAVWSSVENKLGSPTYTMTGAPPGWKISNSGVIYCGAAPPTKCTAPTTVDVFTIQVRAETVTASSGIQPANTTLSSTTNFTWTFTPDAAVNLVVTTPVSPVGAGSSFSVSVRVEDQYGNLVPLVSPQPTIGLTKSGGSATSMLGGTTSKQSVAGEVVFSGLSINETGLGFTLTAAASGFTAQSKATTGPFDVVVKVVSGPVPLTNETVSDPVLPGDNNPGSGVATVTYYYCNGFANTTPCTSSNGTPVNGTVATSRSTIAAGDYAVSWTSLPAAGNYRVVSLVTDNVGKELDSSSSTPVRVG